MDAAISIRDFSKSYGAVKAVDALSLDVARGSLFGLIGPDGAGKTTTMRTLVTLLRPDAGTLTMAGHDVTKEVSRIRAITGYMPQRFSLYPDLSVDQNLTFFADLFGVPRGEIPARKERLYRFSRLEEFSKRLAGRLSGGMKQKLALSCTLIHDPEILILDEPTTGVDPVSRTEFWAILHELKAQGVTILVSTPYMDEAMQCDAVAVMHAGRVLARGTPRDLIDGFGFTVYAVRDRDLVLRAPDMLAAEGVHSVQAFGDSIHVTALPEADAAALTRNLSRALQRPVVLHRVEPSLEDVFIELVEARHAA